MVEEVKGFVAREGVWEEVRDVEGASLCGKKKSTYGSIGREDKELTFAKISGIAKRGPQVLVAPEQISFTVSLFP